MDMTTPAQVAKLIKKELTKKWPGVKFSVRVGRGSCYGTIYADWMRDTLTREEVEAFIGKYQKYSGSDMRSDCNYYDNKREDVPQVSQIWFNHSPL